MGSKVINVKLISEQTIKPSQPTPTHLRFLQTSSIDHVNSPVILPVIFFYAPPRHTSATTTTTTTTTTLFLDCLRNSLPTTLSVFYPLAGRVPDDINYIDCNDDGVPYIEAQVSGAHFESFIDKADVSELDKLTPYHGTDGFSRLVLAIQVNAFPCGGVAIAIKTSHALTDAFSKFMFMKTWGAIASGTNDYTKICGMPYFEISNYFPPIKNNSNYSDTATVTTTTAAVATPVRVFGPDPYLIRNKPVTKWFRFTKPKLDHLRSKLMSKSNITYETTPSLFIVLSAFILSRIKLTCKDENTHDLPFEVFNNVNIRPKLSPPSKSYYFFGNMALYAFAKPSMNGTNTESLCLEYINDVKKAIGNILSDDSMLIQNLQQRKQDLSFMVDPVKRAYRGETLCYGFSNLRHFPMYEADFGWGKPVWVTSATMLRKDVTLFFPAAPPSQDIIAYLNLTAKEMAKLTRDPEFLSIVSTDQVTSKL